MNKARKRELRAVAARLMSVREKDELSECINRLDSLKSEEEDYYDNIPENLQYSFRAEASEEAIEYLDEALDVLNEAYENEDFGSVSDAIILINNAC